MKKWLHFLAQAELAGFKEQTRVQVLAVLALGILATGCAAPGSGMTRVRVCGRIVDSSRQPIAKQQVNVLLPSQYGLSGLDATWGKPENYGHRDQAATLTTDATGRFEHAFSPTTYSTTFWFIPPLGAFPRRPPKPCFYLRLPSQSNEFWVLRMKESGLETELIERDNRISLQQSRTVPAEFSGKLIWQREADPPGYLGDLEMRLFVQTDSDEADKGTDSAKEQPREARNQRNEGGQ